MCRDKRYCLTNAKFLFERFWDGEERLNEAISIIATESAKDPETIRKMLNDTETRDAETAKDRDLIQEVKDKLPSLEGEDVCMITNPPPKLWPAWSG